MKVHEYQGMTENNTPIYVNTIKTKRVESDVCMSASAPGTKIRTMRITADWIAFEHVSQSEA